MSARRMKQGRAWLAGAAVVLLVPVVAWWAIGDLSEVGPGFPNPDYFWRPIDAPQPVVLAIEVSAAVALGAVGAGLAWATLTRRMRPRWWLVIAMTSAAGVMVAAQARVGTARVIGANIGAAVGMFGIMFVALPLYVISLVLVTRWRVETLTSSVGDTSPS